jgi:transcriptional regulator with XRE-family HTH domain
MAAGQTQREVADATDVDAAAVSAIERGKRLPSVLTLWDLAGSLRVSVADLLPEHDPDDVSDGPTEEGATP